MSRKRIGQPISITLTPELKAWIDSKIEHGGTRTEVIRRVLNHAMMRETVGTSKRRLKPVNHSDDSLLD